MVSEESPGNSMKAPRWVLAVSAFRVVVGVGLVVAPAAWSRPWTGSGIDAPVPKLMARMFGVRELLLGVGVLTSMDAPERAARWMQLGSIADAVDGAAVLAAWRDLPRVARYANVTMGFGAAVLNQAAARALLQTATASPQARRH